MLDVHKISKIALNLKTPSIGFGQKIMRFSCSEWLFLTHQCASVESLAGPHRWRHQKQSAIKRESRMKRAPYTGRPRNTWRSAETPSCLHLWSLGSLRRMLSVLGDLHTQWIKDPSSALRLHFDRLYLVNSHKHQFPKVSIRQDGHTQKRGW